MDPKPPRPLLLHRCGMFFCSRWEESKLPFLSSMLFGLLAYVFTFTNKLVIHDDVCALFSKGATIDSGRWGLEILDRFFPNISMPWIYGIISIALIAIAICIMVRMFAIRSKLLQVLLSGCIMVFPSLTGIFNYMFTSSSYAAAFLLAVISVNAIYPSKNSRRIILSFVCLIFSLSIYQAYVALAAGLLILVLLHRLLEGEKPASVLLSGFGYILFLLISLISYYGITQLVLKHYGIVFNSYAASFNPFDLGALPHNIHCAYLSFLQFFLHGYDALIPTKLSRLVHILSAAAVCLLLLIWSISQKRKKLSWYLLLIVLLVLLPLAINGMYLITGPFSIHTLVMHSFVCVYIFVALVADLCLPMLFQKRWKAFLQTATLDIVTLSMFITIVTNIYVANADSLNLYLRYENTYSFYTSLMAQIMQMPEYTPDTKLAVMGDYQQPSFYNEYFPSLYYMNGWAGISPDIYSYDKFIEYYIGVEIPIAGDDEIAEIASSPEYAEMAVYPYYGSVRLIGDTIVVKLSE